MISYSDRSSGVRQRQGRTVPLGAETLALLLPAMMLALMVFEAKLHEPARGTAGRDSHPLRLVADRTNPAGRR